MSIIEKLGITPGPLWCDSHNEIMTEPLGMIKTGKVYYTAPGEKDQSKANGRLYAAAPDMLKRDIDFLEKLDNFIYGCIIAHDTDSLSTARIIRDFFDFSPNKKATGKTWEEIKELLNA